MTYWSVWNVVEASMIAFNVYIRKQEMSQINGLSFQCEKQEEQIKSRISWRIETITEINETNNRKTFAKVGKIKSLTLWSLIKLIIT